jgi:hypothetical protein
MLSEVISQNCRPASQLFQFLSAFGIDRFTILEINGSVIKARIGWPCDGSPDYDPNAEIQEVSWLIDDDPLLDDALRLLQQLSKNQQIDIDKITVPEPEILAIVEELELARNCLDKLLSIKVDMLDDGKVTDFFFVHL